MTSCREESHQLKQVKQEAQRSNRTIQRSQMQKQAVCDRMCQGSNEILLPVLVGMAR